MLFTHVFAIVAILSTSVLASSDVRPRAPVPAPVPGGHLKQTSRAEILRRRQLRKNRPARRAVVSRVAAPATIDDYSITTDSSGFSATDTPTQTFTIVATTNESDALENCVGSADDSGSGSVVLTYSIPNDVYTCSFYAATALTTVADADNGLYISYHVNAA